jgi:hypothetical protein
LVYVDQVLQTLSVDYTISVFDGSSDRYVEFNSAPVENSEIIVAITTSADYLITSESQLILRVGASTGATIAVTTWNDTSEQNLLTQVFVGPNQVGALISQPYDSTDFDEATVTGDPGSFDYRDRKQQL